MKLAVITDTHDQVRLIAEAVRRANQAGCEYLLHLGDIVSPFAVLPLGEFQGFVSAVFGNNDGERLGLQKTFNTIGGEIESPPRKLAIDGKQLVLMHDPYLLDEVAKSQEFDYIFYGHLHEVELRQVGRTFVLNPGDGSGWLKPASFYIVDTQDNRFEKIALG
jgi:uncharacterized protein